VNPAWVSAACALTLIVAGVAAWLLRALWRLFQKTESFLEDWNGRVETPGHPRQQGVMERLGVLESNTARMNSRFDSQDAALADIKSEVMYNSGHSLKDTVTEVRATIAEIVKRLDTFDPPAPPAARRS
jgi:archaellum component FlaC